MTNLLIICGGLIKDKFGEVIPLKKAFEFDSLLEANINAFSCLDIEHIYVVITNVEYHDVFNDKINQLKIKYKNLELIELSMQTSGPSETVYQTIKKANISGSIIIKDCDTFSVFDSKAIKGNIVTGMDIQNIKNARSHKFGYIVEKNGIVEDIAENNNKSNLVATGVYSFEKVEDFCDAYEYLLKSFYRHNISLYISHIISYLIGFKQLSFKFIYSSEFFDFNGKNKTKLMIVDFDGTLVDTFKANYVSYRDSLKQHGYQLDAKTFRRYFGLKYDIFLPKIFPSMSKDIIEKVHDTKIGLYNECIGLVKINKSLLDLIKDLKKEYSIVCCTTASRKSALPVLEHFNILSLFDDLITQEDVSYSKPNTECYYLAMKRFGVCEKDTIIFEDGFIGKEVAKNKKLNVYFVNS